MPAPNYNGFKNYYLCCDPEHKTAVAVPIGQMANSGYPDGEPIHDKQSTN